MSYVFNVAKNFVESMLEKGKEHSEIEKWLRENPFVEGDFVIDTIIFGARPSTTYILDSSFSIEEVEKRVRPPCNYLKLYLGSSNLAKKEYNEFNEALLELEKYSSLEKHEEFRKYKENFLKKLLPFETALSKIRKLAFEEKLMYDVEFLDIIKGFRIYKREMRAAIKRKKVLGESFKPFKPIIPFTISLIDLDSMLVKAFLFHSGYLAGEAEIFEKIGKEVYGLKLENESSEEEVVKKVFRNKDSNFNS
jgi:hypothetical protein